jgi:hypothetical protein
MRIHLVSVHDGVYVIRETTIGEVTIIVFLGSLWILGGTNRILAGVDGVAPLERITIRHS